MDKVSKYGYRDDSPFKDNPFNIINSNLIDMSNTGKPLIGIDNKGNKKYLPAYSGLHKFQGNKVLELPMYQEGDPNFRTNRRISPQQIPAYQSQGYILDPRNPNRYIKNTQQAMQAQSNTTGRPTGGPQMSNADWKNFVSNKNLQSRKVSSDTVYVQPQAIQKPIIQPIRGAGYENIWKNQRIMGAYEDIVRQGKDNTQASLQQSTLQQYIPQAMWQDKNDIDQPIGDPFLINKSEVIGTDKNLIPVTGQQKLDSSRNAYMEKLAMARKFFLGGKYR